MSHSETYRVGNREYMALYGKLNEGILIFDVTLKDKSGYLERIDWDQLSSGATMLGDEPEGMKG